jgi:hypothetical protein
LGVQPPPASNRHFLATDSATHRTQRGVRWFGTDRPRAAAAPELTAQGPRPHPLRSGGGSGLWAAPATAAQHGTAGSGESGGLGTRRRRPVTAAFAQTKAGTQRHARKPTTTRRAIRQPPSARMRGVGGGTGPARDRPCGLGRRPTPRPCPRGCRRARGVRNIARGCRCRAAPLQRAGAWRVAPVCPSSAGGIKRCPVRLRAWLLRAQLLCARRLRAAPP